MYAILSNRLEPSDLETRFRQDGLRRDTGVATILLLIAILFHIVSFPTDFRILGGSDALYVVWGIRVFSTAIAGGTLLLIRRGCGVTGFDNLIFIWAIFLLIGIVAANALFPADYTTHVAWDILLALSVYVVVPLPINRQVIAALIITIGDIVLFWKYKVLEHPGMFFDMVTAFLCANLVGVFASWELQRWRRQQFVALQHEADERRRLEMALLEIKTLKGIIPICANCKNIRTDEGHWRQVEAYVRDHSDADFSHGICPDCERILYPDLFDPGL